MKTTINNLFTALLISVMLTTLSSCVSDGSSGGEETNAKKKSQFMVYCDEGNNVRYIAKMTIEDTIPSFEKIIGECNLGFGVHEITNSSQYGDYFAWRVKIGDEKEKHILINLEDLTSKVLPLSTIQHEGFEPYHSGYPLISKNGKFVTYLTQYWRQYWDVSYPTPVRYNVETDEIESAGYPVKFATSFADPNGDTEATNVTVDHISADGRYIYGTLTTYGVDAGAIHWDYSLIYRYDFENKEYTRLCGEEGGSQRLSGVSPNDKYLIWSQGNQKFLTDLETGTKTELSVSNLPNPILNLWNESLYLIKGYTSTGIYNYQEQESKWIDNSGSWSSEHLNNDRNKILFIDHNESQKYLCQTSEISDKSTIDTICKLPNYVHSSVTIRK